VIAPGAGPVGAGIALLAVGGVLVSKGNDAAGLLCDALGAVFIWSGFRGYRG
jgi:hypothetical protein